MKSFVQRHAQIVTGVLSGFDRLVLHGVPRLFAYTTGLLKYLCHRGIRLKDFGPHSRQLSDRIIAASLQAVEDAGRPVLYLPGSKDDKEALARQIAARDRVREGTICVLKTVELCRSYEVSGNAQTRRIELRHRNRKCLHLYHYQIHPVFGFMHVRLQTWYPFDLQVCLNGREWLSRQLDKAGIGYVRQRNTFTHLDDLLAAQRCCGVKSTPPGRRCLRGLVRSIHPLAREFFVTLPDGSRSPVGYYWTAPQSEWATDVMFSSRAELLPLYERLVRHGITSYGPGDVLRFFGRRVKADGTPWSNFPEEITSDVKTRAKGRVSNTAGWQQLEDVRQRERAARGDHALPAPGLPRVPQARRQARRLAALDALAAEPGRPEASRRSLPESQRTPARSPGGRGQPRAVETARSHALSAGTTPRPSARRHAQSSAAVPRRSTRWRSRTEHCWPPSAGRSSPRTGCATGTSAPCSIRNHRPARRSKNAARQPSRENWRCSARTG